MASFWEIVGDVFEYLENAPAGVSLGVASAIKGEAAVEQQRPQTDYTPEFTNFINQADKVIASGLEPVFKVLDFGIHEVVKPTLSTTTQMLTGLELNPLEAWENAQEGFTAGQAIASGLDFSNTEGLFGYEVHPIYDLTEEERKELFGSGWRKWLSGSIDAAVYALDPMAIGAGAAKRAYDSRKLVRPEEADAVFGLAEGAVAGKRAARQRKWADEVVAKVDGRSAAELYSMDMFKQSADPGAWAALIARNNLENAGDAAVRAENNRLILAAAYGSSRAVEELRGRSAALSSEMDALIGELDTLERTSNFLNGLKAGSGALDEVVGSWQTQVDQLPLLKERRSRIMRMLDEYDRTVGDRLGTAGSLQMISTKDEFARVQGVIDGGARGPIRVLTGKRIPGVFRTDDERSVAIFTDVVTRADWLTPDQRKRLLDRYVAASPHERTQIALQTEAYLFASAAKKWAPEATVEQINAALHHTRAARYSYLRALSQKSRAYGVDRPAFMLASDVSGDMFAIDSRMFDDLLGSRMDMPITTSQLSTHVSMADPKVLKEVMQTLGRHGNLDFAFVRDPARNILQLTDEGLAMMNKFWKFGALFRIGYPIRVQIDSQLRMMAYLKAQYFALAAEGTKNFLQSNMDPKVWKNLEARRIRRQTTNRIGLARMTPQQQTEMDDILREAAALRAEGKEIPKELAKRYQKLAKKVGIEYHQTPDGVFHEITPYRNYEEMTRLFSELGEGSSNIRRLLDQNAYDLKNLRATGNWDLIFPENSRWLESYLRVVNHQWRNDPVAMRVIAGQSDDQIIDWLRHTDEGRKHWREMHAVGYPDEHSLLERVRINIENDLPNTELREKVLLRNLTVDDVNEAFPAINQRPAIRAEIHEEAQQVSRITEAYNDLTERWFTWANDAPELYMARHPVYVARFKHHMKRLIDATYSTDGRVTREQVEAIRQQSRQLAKRDVSRIMFDVFEAGEPRHAIQFVSPFFSAWEDTMVKWSRLVGINPAIIPRGWQAFQAPNNMGIVTDDEGNPIRGDGKVIDKDTGEVVGTASPLDGRVNIPLPKGFAERYNIESFDFYKSGLNFVIQGDPFWLPGPGPMVSVPLNMIATGTIPEFIPGSDWIKNNGFKLAESSWAKPIFDWALPMGTEGDNLALVTPAWIDRLLALVQRESHQRFASDFSRIYAEEAWKIRMGQREPISEQELLEDVMRRSRNMSIIRLATAFASPVALQPQSPMEFYFDEFQRYRREPGGEERFRQDYPDYFEFAISLSESEGGLMATVPAMEAITKYRGEAASNPEFIWYLAGEANIGGEFSETVYDAQFGQNIGPGTTKTFRDRRDPIEVAKRAQADQGWQTYNVGMSLIDSELERRGLWSITQRGAEDLLAAKNNFINELKADNEAWAEEYLSGEGNRFERFIRFALQMMHDHPELLERKENQMLLAYLEQRQMMMQALQARPYSSITHPSNADLALLWEQFTHQMRQQSIGFEQIYNKGGLQYDHFRPIEVSPSA